tara:strand:+ start:796 stop:1077 length:282 start_codon:yes stop_codon:yes gene_type:complete
MIPLNVLQQLMIITAEECGELTQRCSKILRRYETINDIEEEQRQKFLEEAGDVYCMLELLVEHGIVDWKELEDRANVKKEKLTLSSDLMWRNK